LFDLISSNR